MSSWSIYPMVGKLITQPGRHIFFLLPIFPSFSTYTVTISPYILVTTVDMPPSAIKIFFPTSIDFAKSL